jgi:hypothetical protein
MFHYKLRTLLIALVLGSIVLTFAYSAPRLLAAFLTLLASAAFADWLARRMSPLPPK